MIDFLRDLAVVLIAAGLVTVLFHQLRQPLVLGYLIAGVIIGPSKVTLNIIHDRHTVELLAELGVILLMFSLGLHFSIRKLLTVGSVALFAATLEISLMIWIGYQVGRLMGWSWTDSLFLGAILSISSTSIIVKVLSELNLVEEGFARIIFGILIVEDILGIALMATLPNVAKTQAVEAEGLVQTLLYLAIFIAVLLVIGLLMAPRIIGVVARLGSRETLLVTVLALCFGVSLLAGSLGYSVALGAFMIGAVLAECREREQIAALIEPVRDMFSAIFFVAVGMLIDPVVLWQLAAPVALISVAVIFGKWFTCALPTFLSGHSLRTSTRVGLGLAQIGEFSFIIAGLGSQLKVTSDFIYPVAVAVSAVTTLTTPLLVRHADGIHDRLVRWVPHPLLDSLELYTAWANRHRSINDMARHVRYLVRKTLLQIAVNLALITALLGVAVVLAPRVRDWLVWRPVAWIGGANTVVWLVFMLPVLFLLTATFRKVRALSMLVSELTVQSGRTRPSLVLRAMMSHSIVAASMTLVTIWLLLLSSAILPPLPVLVVLVAVLSVVAVVWWRAFIKLYASGQAELEAMLHAPAPHEPEEPARPMPPLLQQARLQLAVIPAGSAAVGKLIRELNVRAATGASAVAVERDGASIINPGPDFELQPGDKVLLLGDAQQTAAAVRMLVGSGNGEG